MKRFTYFNFTVDVSKDTWTIDYNEKTYEYTEFNKIINDLGFQGWELTSVVNIITRTYPSAFTEISDTHTSKTVHYFKKELSDAMIEEMKKAQEEMEKDTSDINELIELFTADGYQIKFQHNDRIIFGKGIKEVRFDYSKSSNQWIKK